MKNMKARCIGCLLCTDAPRPKQRTERRFPYKVEGMQAHRSAMKKEIVDVGGFIEEGGYTNGSTTFAYLADLTKKQAAQLDDRGWTVERWND